MFILTFNKWLVAVVLLGATFMAHAQSTTYVAASTANYTTFANFTACGTPPCQNFSTAMSVSGSFTTSAPLAANLASANVAPLITSYSFSDGLTTYANTDPDSRIYFFEITTNGSGAITDVNILLERWLTGTSPHVAGDRIAFLQTYDGTANNNWRCNTIAVSPAGAADSCSAAVNDTSSSRASKFTLTVAPAASKAASIPTLSEWGLIGLSGLLGFSILLHMWRAKGRESSVANRRLD